MLGAVLMPNPKRQQSRQPAVAVVHPVGNVTERRNESACRHVERQSAAFPLPKYVGYSRPHLSETRYPFPGPEAALPKIAMAFPEDGGPLRLPQERKPVAKQIESRGSASDPHTNRILAALEPDDFEGLMAEAKVVSFKLKKRLYRQDEKIDAVYFPLTCMVSMLVGPRENDLVETATIGMEGVAGTAGLAPNQSSMGLHLIQLPGTAVRIDADVFRKHLASRPLLRNIVEQHMYALTRQILYGAATGSTAWKNVAPAGC